MTKRASDVKYTGGANEVGSSRQRCAETQAVARDRSVRIRATIFFDGTLNDRTNTQLGETGINKGASYANALTNIAILEQYFKQNEH